MRDQAIASSRAKANTMVTCQGGGLGRLYSISSPRSFTSGTLYSRKIAVIAA